MKTCKLEIKTDLYGQETFVAYIDSVVIHPTGEKITTKLDEVTSLEREVVINFLEGKGVERKEAVFALNFLEESGHNKAYFGMLGGFVTSEFTGKVH